ncbi:MipA/OmpV family protein [Pseudoalteromonas sp. Of7M-16]|uniref:MipA/OmpV family protein n=1 Tax=Pseudoalteromonas sp. Of7M-16 TaxID=2917756 RepID=UPI001EF72FAE|nr:MipA/OmpV family protein [Pseudoalteromonas sp. Of7M-16]MCG7549586.1 MipA/OmpV family protein [Pseudoalteromonas sp. Of7M-16]
MKQFSILLSICFYLFSTYSVANCNENDEQCAEIGRWEFSVAVGGGIATNPVRGGDNIPLVILPYINYYGDKFFFDNTTLGFTFTEQEKFDVSLIAQLNTEQAYFERFHPSNILVKNTFTAESNAPPVTPSPGNPTTDPNNSDEPGIGTDNGSENGGDSDDKEDKEPTPKSITIDKIAKRDWAIDSGILAHWYFKNDAKITFSWLHDVTNTYQGHHGSIDYSFVVPTNTQNPSRLRVKVGAEYKDKSLVDYYYGISQQDTQSEHFLYEGKATVNPFLAVAFNYKLNSDWQLKFSARHTWLGSGIKNSPLIERDYTSNIFIGGLYEF